MVYAHEDTERGVEEKPGGQPVTEIGGAGAGQADGGKKEGDARDEEAWFLMRENGEEDCA